MIASAISLIHLNSISLRIKGNLSKGLSNKFIFPKIIETNFLSKSPQTLPSLIAYFPRLSRNLLLIFETGQSPISSFLLQIAKIVENYVLLRL